MVTTQGSNSISDNNSVIPQASPPPPYMESENEVASNGAYVDDEGVVLKVLKLEDEGKLANVQWKQEKDAETTAPAHNAQGYGVLVTVMFVVGEMVGTGIISMPNALYRQGWVGIAVIVILCVASGYTGIQLGRCWMILQDRWPDRYLKHTQNPYPEIGFQAGGVWCRRAVTFCVHMTMFGSAIVLVLIISRNAELLLRSWTNTDISFCLFVLMVAAIALPVTYLGSPKDFWQVSVGAAVSTTIAVIIMIIGMSMDYSKNESVEYPAPTFVSFILGYGTIAFACSGQSGFPTIQHDMKHPERFDKAVIISYIIMFAYYLPLCILGYVVYGDRLHGETVLPSLPPGWIQNAVTVLITLHVFFGLIIYINPGNQEVERVFKVPPNRFTWKRIVIRTITLAAVVFIAESIPAMNLILDLLGGTCMTLLTYVFPSVFYLSLRWKTTTNVSKNDTPIRKWELVVTAIIILMGILGAVASVYAFFYTVATGGHLFKMPCYINGGL